MDILEWQPGLSLQKKKTKNPEWTPLCLYSGYRIFSYMAMNPFNLKIRDKVCFPVTPSQIVYYVLYLMYTRNTQNKQTENRGWVCKAILGLFLWKLRYLLFLGLGSTLINKFPCQHFEMALFLAKRWWLQLFGGFWILWMDGDWWSFDKCYLWYEHFGLCRPSANMQSASWTQSDNSCWQIP